MRTYFKTTQTTLPLLALAAALAGIIPAAQAADASTPVSTAPTGMLEGLTTRSRPVSVTMLASARSIDPLPEGQLPRDPELIPGMGTKKRAASTLGYTWSH